MLHLFQQIFASQTQNNRASQLNSSAYSSSFANEAVVTIKICPNRKGQVRYRGGWWTARCRQSIVLQPNDVVQVVDREEITLIVEPFNSSNLHRL